MEKTNATRSWFFERIKKINGPLTRLTKEKERVHKLLVSEIKEMTSLPNF